MQPIRIWHIDDEDVFRRLFKIFCRRHQLPIILRSFEDARSAIDAILTNDSEALPDLIVLDLRLPGFDGFDFLRTLNAVKPDHDVPVYVLSSSTDVRDTIEAYACGASSYFLKDEVEELLWQIRTLCSPELSAAVGG